MCHIDRNVKGTICALFLLVNGLCPAFQFLLSYSDEISMGSKQFLELAREHPPAKTNKNFTFFFLFF